MNIASTPRRSSGFSLGEQLTVLTIVGLIAVIAVPQLDLFGTSARRHQNRRAAENIVHVHAIGQAAGVEWPAGGVAAKVMAVVAGGKPTRGAFANRVFEATVKPDTVEGTFVFIGMRPNGDLFFDPKAEQNPDGF